LTWKEGVHSTLIKKIAFEHGIQYVAAPVFVRRTDENGLTTDCHEYLQKGLYPVVCSFNVFEKSLETLSINDIFVNIEHLTEIGTLIIAHEVYQFLWLKNGLKW